MSGRVAEPLYSCRTEYGAASGGVIAEKRMLRVRHRVAALMAHILPHHLLGEEYYVPLLWKLENL